MDDYRDIKEMLRPRRDIRASEALHRKVREALDRKRRARIAGKWLAGGLSLGAVAAVMLLMLIPSGMSAEAILSEAIDALEGEEDVEMIVEVRTRPMENFRYIGLTEEFVTHHIDIARSDSLLQWRIDKGGRVATGNGRDIHIWLPALNLGLHLADTDNEKVLGYLEALLTPRRILENELHSCRSRNDVDYRVHRNGNDIILTVHAAPRGNFDNPYLLNTSINESENIREYVMDAESGRLKRAVVSVVSGNRKTVVLRIASVSYGNRKEEICRLPGGIRFVETVGQPDGLTGIDAEEAASTVLHAFADWNDSIIGKVMIREVSDAAYREKFRGARLISIGMAFTSGTGNSVFVPYTLRLRDGTMLRHNIALQKTDSGGWFVAGGL